MRHTLAGLVIISLTAFAAGQQTGPVNWFSLQKEAALGNAMANQVSRGTTPLRVPGLDQYVAIMGARLAAHMPQTPRNWTFATIREPKGGPTNEPVAVPGGHIFVSAFLFVKAANEAEFSGMLAHAMAHVVLRHGTRQATHAELAQLSSIPLLYTGPVEYPGEMVVPAAFVKYWRQYEMQADQLAATAMAAAGYDPQALVNYLARQQPTASRPYSALPPLAERLANLRATIQYLPKTPALLPAGDYSVLQTQIRAAIANETARPIPSLLNPKR